MPGEETTVSETDLSQVPAKEFGLARGSKRVVRKRMVCLHGLRKYLKVNTEKKKYLKIDGLHLSTMSRECTHDRVSDLRHGPQVKLLQPPAKRYYGFQPGSTDTST
jgi:hypothetical protein